MLALALLRVWPYRMLNLVPSTLMSHVQHDLLDSDFALQEVRKINFELV